MNTPFAIFPNRHAFLFGAQAYTDAGIRPLKTPTQDIRLMGDALAAYGYQTHLYPDPDRATFVQALEGIRTVDPNGDAQIVIYYAGHGVALTQQQADGPPTYGGYLLPVDAQRNKLADTAISMQWVADQIGQLNGKQVLLILDCCYAGAVRQATSAFRGSIDTETDDISQDDFGHYTRYRANQILTSSAHNQQALDQYIGPGNNANVADNQVATSPFATLLSRALTNRDADSNRDGIVTVYELQLYIQQRLKTAASLQQHEQTSCLFAFSSHEGGEFLFLEPSFSPTALGQRQRVNPYKGLDAYQPEDATFFYGRDSAIKDLNRLLTAARFVVVVGASGTGKSSLVKAGVLGPYHRAGTSYATIRPGKNPLAELESIRQNPPSLLLIDQMEELVTQATDRSDEELVRFFAELSAFQQGEAGKKMKVLATLRIEFVPQINRADRFWVTDKQQYTIPVLDVDCLQEIIIRPALQTGMFYYPEKETVARIIEDFRHYPNALPLLSLALNELYESAKDRPERTIYERDYPGIGQILEKKEETIIQPFRANMDFFRDLLLRFVAFQSGEYVRRRVGNGELDFGPQQELCEQILKTLTDNRLVAGRDPGTGEGYYELTHEALIGSWSTYRQWIQTIGSTQLSLRDELAEAANTYVRLGSRMGYVWGTGMLDNLFQAVYILNKRTSRWSWFLQPYASEFRLMTWLSVPERAFLKRSIRAQVRKKMASAGMGAFIFMVIGGSLFLQSRDAYVRLLNNAQYAESQNAYQTAQQEYKAADTLANQDMFLRLGRGYLAFDPDLLPQRADSSGLRDRLYKALSRQLERADTLTSNTVLLLAGRNDPTRSGTGVAQACRAFGQFIQTDVLYRTLDDDLRQPQTRQLLGDGTVGRFRKRAQAGYQQTGVMRENLLAICREVQEGYQLNGQPDLVAQYGRYIRALDTYQKKVSSRPADRQVASTVSGR